MTARLLQLLLLVQALAALLIAWGLWRGGVLASPWLALACGLGAVLAVRLAITFNNFVLSWRFRSATPEYHALGAMGRVRMFGEEFMATLLHSSWFMPRASAAMRVHAASAHNPVLLLHGYGCNSGYWVHLERRLDAQAISHASVDLEPMLAGIDDYIPTVAAAIDALRAASGAQHVDIVAHSMGGLVARAYMRAHGSMHIGRVITLGTPHHGTSLASFGPGLNAAQMRHAGQWLQALAAAEDPAARRRITSIYTHHDNIVAPQASSILTGADNIGFSGIGHVALGRNPRVLDRVMALLAPATEKRASD